jgi:3-oxoacyl-[acyl-carrier-protein] synthase II
VARALCEAGIDPRAQRVIAIVGSGLRELNAVERAFEPAGPPPLERLHFARAVREAAPGIERVITLSNACSAAGHCLALAQDLIEAGDLDAVVVGGADSMTESMLAMIGRVSDAPTDCVRPFDAARQGVLLGEGAAALVIVPEHRCERPLGRLLATGLSCDAHHPTAPDPAGIERALRDALARAERSPEEVDLIVAHGTGTALNDPIEATVIAHVFGRGHRAPCITAVKGAIGHTSGAAALASADVALRCFARGVVPAIVGLREPLREAENLQLVMHEPRAHSVQLAQVHAFGFGGVNAVSLIEAVS